MSQAKTKCSTLQMRNDVVAEAREWIGTPYHHQSYAKKLGCDCVGLVVSVGINAGVLAMTSDDIKSYSGYGKLPNSSHMHHHLSRFFTQINDPGIADVAWIQWRLGLPMHLGILSEHDGRRTLIHAFSHFGKVIEHTVDDLWESRIHSYWRYPGIV